MEKTCILYHTFTKNSEMVAQRLKEDLGISQIELLHTKEPEPEISGFCSYLSYICSMICDSCCCGKNKIAPEVQDLQTDLSEMETVIIVSPTHGMDVTHAMRDFLDSKKEILKEKQLVLVQLSGGPKDVIRGKVISRIGYEKPLIFGVIQGGFGGKPGFKDEMYVGVLENIKKGLANGSEN